ncbi:MAG TPA: biotin/lipoyl-binding protein, partial [Gemmatimonadales bacterium]|nr:biotin/lipoyl-binding protein [Gemmatimonadales bacterium]
MATTEEAPETVRQPRRRVGLVIAGVLVVIAAIFGVRRWRWGLTHEKTDDAQVDGHVIPVLAKVGGYVASVRVVENREVQAGDTLATLDDRDLRAALDKANAEVAAAISSSGSSGRVG